MWNQGLKTLCRFSHQVMWNIQASSKYRSMYNVQFDENLWQPGRVDIQLHVTRLMTSCLFQFDHVGANPYSLA